MFLVNNLAEWLIPGNFNGASPTLKRCRKVHLTDMRKS